MGWFLRSFWDQNLVKSRSWTGFLHCLQNHGVFLRFCVDFWFGFVTFHIFVFLQKVLPDMVFTVFSALPDFDVKLHVVLFLLQFFMDLLHIL